MRLVGPVALAFGIAWGIRGFCDGQLSMFVEQE